MGKGKIVSLILFILGIFCIGMYFVFKNGNHTVSFDSDGGSEVKSVLVKDNELVTRPTDPTRNGYEFVEWDLNNAPYNFQTAVTSDITLKAVWKQIFNVKITLDNNEYNTKVAKGEKIDISVFHFPERDGYIIKLYTKDSKEYDLKTLVNQDMELKANYVALQSFTVKFNSNGGSKIDDVKVWEGSLLTEPNTTRKGYYVEGWYDGDVKYDFAKPVMSDLNLKAQWVENGKYQVSFNIDGKLYKNVIVKAGDKVKAIDNPKKDGYVFVAWQLDGRDYNFDNKVNSSLILEAKFKTANKYTVKFDSNGGSSIKDVEVYEGSTVSKPSNPTRSGYDFIEWQLNNKGYNFSNAVNSDMTLVAKWEQSKPTYKVSFNSNGGSKVNDKYVNENETVARPADPTRENYKFVAWKLNGENYNFGSKVVKNITLDAEWRELLKFTVTFESEGIVIKPAQEITEDQTAVEPSVPEKDGFRFIEWQLNGNKYDFSKPVTSNLKLEAKWEQE